MTDYTELKRLAESLIELNRANLMDWAATIEDARIGRTHTEYALAANPAAVLALIAENERLKTSRSVTERDLAQELEVWRNGPSCWSCGDTGDVHDLTGEWRGECDCLAAQLIDANRENAKLKAECEGQRESLTHAADEVESWGAYASDYFQQKHDLAGTVLKVRQAAVSKESGQ